jgi:hypothetical protein
LFNASKVRISTPASSKNADQPSLTKLALSTGERFQPLIVHNVNSLRSELAAAAAQGDRARGIKLQMLIATAEGRYDFTQRNLNAAFPGLQVERFAGWFVKKWDLEQGGE